MPKVSAEYLDKRRQVILDAALSCFARNGFHETTIQDVAREAGVSHGAIYRYFPSKEDMVVASAHRDRAARAKRFDAAEEAGTPLEVLDAVLSGYIARHWGPERTIQARLRAQLFSEAVRNPRTRKLVQINREDVLDKMSAIVRRAQADGQIDPTLDPRAVARVAAAIYDGLTIQQALDTTLDLAMCIPVVSALLRGTFAQPPGREVQ